MLTPLLRVGSRWHAAAGRAAITLCLLLACSTDCRAGPDEPTRWEQAGQLTPAAQQLAATLRDVRQFGLDPRDYAEALGAVDGGPTARDAPADLDAVLDQAALRLITQLHDGRVDPRSAGYALSRQRAPIDREAALLTLARAADVPATLATFEPRFAQYRELKRLLARYRSMRELPSLPALPPGAAVSAGAVYAGAPQLREYLAQVEDAHFPPGTDSRATTYDDTLAAAVAGFQSHHGLQADGKLGPRTFAALNVPLARRIRQIELTMERLRWLPDIHAPAVIVNVPQFMLYTLPAPPDTEVMRIPVIVGASARQTPVFDSRIEAVVFRPYWDIPDSILREELLPLISRDRGYLARHEMEIVGHDGQVLAADRRGVAALRAGRARLRQRPGDQNALGLIKFLLPNPYGVYLHSTPEARLFGRDQRALSHGCVRVSDAAGLAAYLLARTPGDWSRDAIEAATCAAATQTVHLAEPVPVFVLYVTVVVEQDGGALFFDDVYGHDQMLDALLERH